MVRFRCPLPQPEDLKETRTEIKTTPSATPQRNASPEVALPYFRFMFAVLYVHKEVGAVFTTPDRANEP